MRQLVAAFLLTISFYSFAQAQTDEREMNTNQTNLEMSKSTIHRGWAPFLGASAGYTGESENNDARNVEGSPSSLKLLGSLATPNLKGIFDIGYGIQGQTYSTSTNDSTRSSFSTGTVELAARYQFVNRWQVGAVYDRLFDKGEEYGANQADALFGGLQALKEFSFGDSYIGRVGLRAMSSLNVDEEAVNMAMIDFQIGWGGALRSRAQATGTSPALNAGNF